MTGLGLLFGLAFVVGPLELAVEGKEGAVFVLELAALLVAVVLETKGNELLALVWLELSLLERAASREEGWATPASCERGRVTGGDAHVVVGTLVTCCR
jgi:hypothetical protein